MELCQGDWIFQGFNYLAFGTYALKGNVRSHHDIELNEQYSFNAALLKRIGIEKQGFTDHNAHPLSVLCTNSRKASFTLSPANAEVGNINV